MLNRTALLVAGTALLVSTVPAQAQQLNVTGSGAWDICWLRTEFVTTGSPCSTTWEQATRITSDPFGWADVPTEAGAYYIGANTSGTVDPNAGNESPTYTYTFRTNLGLTDYTGFLRVDLSTFFLDNYWVGWSFDGVNFYDSGITPDPLDPEATNWKTEFQLAAYENLTAYDGDFYLRITGNGITDGILASGTVSVPEPGTYVLLLTGLLGLGLVGFRRRELVGWTSA